MTKFEDYNYKALPRLLAACSLSFDLASAARTWSKMTQTDIKEGVDDMNIKHTIRDIFSGHFPPPWGRGKILSKLKNREEFEGGLHEKRKGKEEKRKE